MAAATAKIIFVAGMHCSVLGSDWIDRHAANRLPLAYCGRRCPMIAALFARRLPGHSHRLPNLLRQKPVTGCGLSHPDRSEYGDSGLGGLERPSLRPPMHRSRATPEGSEYAD